MTEAVGDRSLFEIGTRVWPHTFGAGMDFNQTALWLEKHLVDTREPGDTEHELALLHMKGLWSVTWVDSGCPTLVLASDKFAAALACTRATADIADDLELPWRAFYLKVPPGLLAVARPSTGGTRDYSRIAVFGGTMPSIMLLIDPSKEDGATQILGANTVAELLFADPDQEAFALWEDGDAKLRMMNVARRLVVGALYALQTTPQARKKSAASHGGSGREGPPRHRAIMLGRPMRLDLRAEVARYVAEGRGGSPPTVQSLVRGHYKRQVVGIGRGGRKIIWVEPYWRGPEDAPILARPYQVG